MFVANHQNHGEDIGNNTVRDNSIYLMFKCHQPNLTKDLEIISVNRALLPALRFALVRGL